MTINEQYYCYILASRKDGALYTGVTSDLIRRIYEHKSGTIEGFSKRYDIKTLVWYEAHASIQEAISREKQIKKWNRAWKNELIESNNPDWHDLYPSLINAPAQGIPAFAGMTM